MPPAAVLGREEESDWESDGEEPAQTGLVTVGARKVRPLGNSMVSSFGSSTNPFDDGLDDRTSSAPAAPPQARLKRDILSPVVGARSALESIMAALSPRAATPQPLLATPTPSLPQISVTEDLRRLTALSERLRKEVARLCSPALSNSPASLGGVGNELRGKPAQLETAANAVAAAAHENAETLLERLVAEFQRERELRGLAEEALSNASSDAAQNEAARIEAAIERDWLREELERERAARTADVEEAARRATREATAAWEEVLRKARAESEAAKEAEHARRDAEAAVLRRRLEEECAMRRSAEEQAATALARIQALEEELSNSKKVAEAAESAVAAAEVVAGYQPAPDARGAAAEYRPAADARSGKREEDIQPSIGGTAAATDDDDDDDFELFPVSAAAPRTAPHPGAVPAEGPGSGRRDDRLQRLQDQAAEAQRTAQMSERIQRLQQRVLELERAAAAADNKAAASGDVSAVAAAGVYYWSPPRAPDQRGGDARWSWPAAAAQQTSSRVHWPHLAYSPPLDAAAALRRSAGARPPPPGARLASPFASPAPVGAPRPAASAGPAPEEASAAGRPSRAAKALLDGADRRWLGTADYLASLPDEAAEVDRVGKGLRDADALAVAAHVRERGPRVERLFLSGNRLGPAAAAALAALLADPALRVRRLDLRHNGLGDAGCAALASGLRAAGPAGALSRLDLSANGVTAAGAAALAAALSEIAASSSEHATASAEEGAAGGLEANVGLTRLDLRHNGIGDAGAEALAAALRVQVG